MKNHKKLKLDQEPTVDYLGHPLNAFNFIKHSALGWKHFHFNIVPVLNSTFPHLGKSCLVKFRPSIELLFVFPEYVINRPELTEIPDHSEIDGAAHGLARLHMTYELNPQKMIQEGIIQSDLPDMAHFASMPSVKRLSSKF